MKIKGVLGTEFQISSKSLAIIFAATGALLAALSAKAIPVPMGIPDIWADYAASWANFLIKLWAPIGPTLLVLFSDSTPGPLAPRDPLVVQEATAKAVDMGQIAKALFIAIILIGAFGAFDHAHAKARVTCTPGFLGCPPIGSGTGPSAVTVIPTPGGSVAPKDIFSGLLTFQSEVVANLQQADTYEAAPLNTSLTPPAAYNPTAHECLVGMPGQGTAGQPGYIAPSIGLIAWVHGLAPLAGASIPPLPGPQSAACLADMAATPAPTGTPLDCVSPSPATEAVYADNLAEAALNTASSLTSQISSGNFPGFSDLKQSCGGMLQHVQEEVGQATTDVAAFTALIAKYVMPVVAAHKGLLVK